MKIFSKMPKRLLTQIVFFILQNPLLGNFFTGRIYSGELKRICTPGLNCYSCPAAVTSCPIGAMQLFLAGAKHSISLFVAGLLLCIGVIFGRFICGYVCPMGLVQDLLYKIKTRKLRLKLTRARYIKYVVLAVFVILLPLLVRHELSGLGYAWFCMYICPSGTLFGAIPLLAVNDFLREMTGTQFYIKLSVLAAVIISTVFIYRIFCRVLCPLGAIYALFNKFSIVRMHCDTDKCSKCGNCSDVCQIRLNPSEQPNSPECVRCGSCVKNCKTKALRCSAFGNK